VYITHVYKCCVVDPTNIKILVYVCISTSLLLCVVILSVPVLGCSSVFWVSVLCGFIFHLLFLGGMSYSFCALLSSSPVWVRLVHFVMAFYVCYV
jgi:hypothetical protein